MTHRTVRALALALCILLSAFDAHGASPLRFSVTFDASLRKEPTSGRLVVYLLRADAPVSRRHLPADGFVEEDPQPIYGVDVRDIRPGDAMMIDDSATAFPTKLSELPAGKYRVQAVLDMHRENSSWQREPGNLTSVAAMIDTTQSAEGPIELTLTRAIQETPRGKVKGVEIVSVRSKLLSDFLGKEVILRAGVAYPVDYDAQRQYAAVYEVPGFGGDYSMAYFKAARRGARPRGSPADLVARNTFWIFLDSESGNGPTMFADSDNNGPWGKALTTELIPAIEKQCNLVVQPAARIITGHSTGGWSSLWLATEYPDFFGACWSSSPDPVDFRRFEQVDIYAQPNMYVDGNGKDWSSARFDGKSTMTVRQENGMEQSLGTDNNASQQWDSWQAVFGHRRADGGIQPLYDAITGAIDKAEAESYRRYDIADRLRKDPKRFVPIFREHVRLVCGREDTYYLNEAVELLKNDLDQLDPPQANDARPGYIKLAAGDHQSVSDTPEMLNWAEEIMTHLRNSGFVAKAEEKK